MAGASLPTMPDPGRSRMPRLPRVVAWTVALLLTVEFLQWTAARQFSVYTVKARRIEMGYFIDWCEQRAIVRPDEVTRGASVLD